MLDPYIRPLIDPPLNFIGKRLASLGISANVVTLIGFTCGLGAMVLISIESYTLAILFLGLNRLLDGIDGAVARHRSLNDFGGMLDILCDFIIYAGVVFAFGVANSKNLFYASFLIFSFIGPITSFLAYAIIAAKKNVNTTRRGHKSFYHLGGICEGTETSVCLILLCLFPSYFNVICITYGILCWLTTVGRVYCAWSDFSDIVIPIKSPTSSLHSSPNLE